MYIINSFSFKWYGKVFNKRHDAWRNYLNGVTKTAGFWFQQTGVCVCVCVCVLYVYVHCRDRCCNETIMLLK